MATVSLLTVCLATAGCGKDDATDVSASASPAAVTEPVAAPTQAAPVEEPEPEVSETPSSMDDYVKQRREARKARGPVDYPSPVSQPADDAETGDASGDPSATPTPGATGDAAATDSDSGDSGDESGDDGTEE